MTRPPSAKRCVMMWGASSPLSSVCTWNSVFLNLMLLLNPICARRNAGLRISVSTLARYAWPKVTMACSSAVWSPATPSMRSKAACASGALGSMRSASASRVWPALSLGPVAAHAARSENASSGLPFSTSQAATLPAFSRETAMSSTLASSDPGGGRARGRRRRLSGWDLRVGGVFEQDDVRLRPRFTGARDVHSRLIHDRAHLLASSAADAQRWVDVRAFDLHLVRRGVLSRH